MTRETIWETDFPDFTRSSGVWFFNARNPAIEDPYHIGL